MTWWRRDSVISPVQRYAQRLLRSHEAALRARGFSRAPSQKAQHGDDKDSNRPAGMSNLEWMQLQHYQRWRKKLMEDPYQALFGASNDMLSGKGLKHWEWISNSFPKWMLEEMKDHGDATPRSKSDKDTTSSERYPKKAGIEHNGSNAFKERESHFPQPSFRTTRIGGDDSRAIISPSDLRRPSEHPHVTVIGESIEASPKPNSNPHISISQANGPQPFESPPPTPPKSTQSFSDYIVKTKSNAAEEIGKLDKPSIAQGTSFMDGFLSEKPPQEPNASAPDNISTWRETTLQRRSLQRDEMKRNTTDEILDSTPIIKEPEILSSTPAVDEHSSSPPTKQTVPVATMHERPHFSIKEDINISEGCTAPTKSTSETLSQLPEDDIDFLSAADIRASMGAKKSRIPSDEQRKSERENLEKSFADAHVENNEVDSMIESKIINDQLVRRIERKMQIPDKAMETNEPQPATKADQNSSPANEAQIESSIERMKSWLEQSGAMFSNYFWQDPTEEADAKKTRLFFDKVLARIRKGRSTMRQVIEDLESDVPSSKPLLKRMKADEEVLDSAIHALRQRSGSGKISPLTPRKVRAIQSLRLKYQDTDNDLNKAYAALEEIGKSEAAKNTPLAFKQRLGMAAKIIQKNAHLTRYLIWSLQARLEDPEIDRSMLVNYKAVANSLLTLRDTQTALSRLVDRAMLVYGVVPQTAEKLESMGQTNVNAPSDQGHMPRLEVSASMTEIDKAQLRAKIAAEERLANEVHAQKSAMCGLSDDGYVRESKTATKKPFEERTPLDHSLYRPFGPVLESLGSELPSRVEVSKYEEVEQKYDDAELVAEVQKAYEDTYGPITIEHHQLADTAEVKHEHENTVQKFEMLKDDPTVQDEISVGATATEMPQTEVTTSLHAHDDAVSVQAETYTGTSASAQPTEASSESATETSSTAISSPIPTAHLPTHYIILIHDAETNTPSLTTSTSPPPRDTSPPIPLHNALSTLSSPSKFIPHITPNLEIVTAKPDMLILRDVLNPASTSNTIANPLQSTEQSDPIDRPTTIDYDNADVQRVGSINPIDGTTRLSPTGYVGPEENREQLEKEFEERRRAAEQVVLGSSSTTTATAAATAGAGASDESAKEQGGTRGTNRGARGRRGAGVAKTAIWAAATCYVVGVLGELVG